MPTDEQKFLDQFSIENLIRKATEPQQSLMIPSEYSQPKPDMLGMQVDQHLANFDAPNQVGHPGVPYAQVNYDATLPVVGKDVGVGDITSMIRQHESSGNYTALNREQKGNTASGAYQYTDAAWNGFGGYPKAMLAPKAVQDAKFAQDIQARFAKFHGDPYKMIAAHYLPAAAGNPAVWDQPYRLPSGRVVTPVAQYVATIIKGTPLEGQFNAYLARHKQG